MAWVGSWGCLAAQNEASGTNFRILTFGTITGADRLVVLDPLAPEERQEVELQLNNFTGPYRVKSRKFVLSADPVSDPPKAVATVSLLESHGPRVLLVLVPNAGPDSGYLAVPIRDDVEGFAAGERRFVNLTDAPIGAEFDGKRHGIKANGVTPLKLPKPPEERRVHEVAFYQQMEGEWKPLTSSVWPHDPEARSLVFFYREAGEKRIRIQSIAEVATE